MWNLQNTPLLASKIFKVEIVLTLKKGNLDFICQIKNPVFVYSKKISSTQIYHAI